MARPNLLWLFCDQLRYHALACNGDPNVLTPNLDRLARGGVRCTRTVSHYPVCMPFRAGLVTGQYAHVHGLRVQGDALPPRRRTIAHAFRQAGYRTSWVGKWHLAGEHGARDFWVDPALRGGFQDWYGFNVANDYYRCCYCHGDAPEPIPLRGYQTDALTDLSLRYLSDTARTSEQPWFHCLSVEAPHHGIGRDGRDGHPAPPEYEARFSPAAVELRGNVPPHLRPRARTKLAGYYAMIANLDHNVGRVLDWLEHSGLAGSTLVVFFSDHGELAGSQGFFGKYRPYDEAVRIPLLLRMPGILPAGTVYDEVVSGLDLFATCAGLCGVPLVAEQQGLDHAPALRGGSAVRGEALIQWLGGSRSAWDDGYLYRAIRTRRYTYCVGPDEPFRLLFDNQEDELQRTNLFGRPQAAALQARLHRRLCNAVTQSGEPLPAFLTYGHQTGA